MFESCTKTFGSTVIAHRVFNVGTRGFLAHVYSYALHVRPQLQQQRARSRKSFSTLWPAAHSRCVVSTMPTGERHQPKQHRAETRATVGEMTVFYGQLNTVVTDSTALRPCFYGKTVLRYTGALKYTMIILCYIENPCSVGWACYLISCIRYSTMLARR
jgi:hypothetical protein